MLFALARPTFHLGDLAGSNLPVRLEPVSVFAEAADA